jgi:hypothetical protein
MYERVFIWAPFMPLFYLLSYAPSEELESKAMQR